MGMGETLWFGERILTSRRFEHRIKEERGNLLLQSAGRILNERTRNVLMLTAVQIGYKLLTSSNRGGSYRPVVASGASGNFHTADFSSQVKGG
jgi:hypothetical protein